MIARIVDSKPFLALTLVAVLVAVVLSVPIMFTSQGRPTVAPEVIVDVQDSVPVQERQSVVVYGDSRAAYFGDGASLVPGWFPLDNEGREGCVFLSGDHFWKQYGTSEPIRERNTSKQSTGETVDCDVRTYIPSTERYDLAIVYAGTLFSVNNGVTADVKPPTDPATRAYLLNNFTQTLRSINAETVVVLGTPISTNVWEALGDPFWDNRDRVDAVNSILFEAASAVGAIYLPAFALWVESQPRSCQPDGGHFTIECARAAGLWIQAALSDTVPIAPAVATSTAVRLLP